MRIDILDPGLYTKAGHHLEWNLRLARELTARGHKVHVHSHMNLDVEAAKLLSHCALVTPRFRILPYWESAPSLRGANGSRPLSDPVSGQLVHFLDGAQLLAEDLHSLEDADLRIWPSLAAHQLYASSLSASRIPNVSCIHVESSIQLSAGPMFWRYAWLASKKAGLDFRFGVTVPELQEHFSSLVPEQKFSILPICLDGRTPSKPRPCIRRIGFFGHQRGEKGIGLLNELVSRLLPEGWEVVVQDSGGLIHGNGSNNLISLGYVKDIAEEINKCDLIVVPYQESAYRYRGSSVVWEALACGVPVIVPRKTAPSNFAMTLQAGKEFFALAVSDVHSAIKSAEVDYKFLADKAYLASKNWANTHGVSRFTDAILDSADT